MTLLVYRRRFWILLVPIINLVFLLLFIFSPSSLPRLPQRWTRFSRLQSLKNSGLSNESFEQISFQKNGQSQDGTDPSLGVNYLLEQRKLVEGVYLKPLPDHLITTYRPGYLDPSGSVSPEQQEQENIDLDPTTKYLTFLPHSGFHNQRSELENALLLARLLNRTLIMPKVYLGPPMPWLTFSQLHARLLYQTKIGLDHCRAILENQVEEELESGLESIGKNNEHETIKEDHQLEQQQQSQSQSLAQPQPQPQSELQESQQQQQPENYSSQHHHHHRHHHQYQRPLHVEEDPFQIGSHQDDETVDEAIEFTTATPEEDASRDHSFGEEITSSDIPLDALYRPREEEDEEDADTDLSDIEVGQQWREEEDEQDEEEGGDDMKEDMTPSWFEEPEDDDLDQFMIATGDSFGDMMDLEGDDIDIDNDVDDESDEDQGQDVQDWEAVEESEEEGEEDEGDDEVEEIHVGIVDDDDDDEDINWPESFALPAHPQTRRRSRSRMSLEIEDSQESSPIDNPLEVDSRETHQRMWKRSLPEERDKADQEADITPDSAPSSQSLQEHQTADQDTLQGQEQQSSPTKNRRGKWNPLPAECLQYESWTMTDWDLFFDLNTLRRYVRVVTRESMSIAYLHDRFNLESPMEEEPPKSNSTTARQGADTTSSIDSGSVGAGTDSEDDSKDNDDGTDSGDGSEEENNKKKMLSLRTVGDILFFDDTSLYDYRFTENPEEAESQRTRPKFVQEFTIGWLAQRPERLIHLGSIFGSGRVSIDSLKSRAWHQMIRDHLTIRTEILQTTSQRIADRIRGSAEEAEGTISGSRTGIQSYGQPLMDPMEAGFVGIHVRMSDGHFSLSARDTIENIRQELMWQMDISDEDEDNDSPRRGRLSIEQCRTRALSHHRMIQEELQKQQQPQDPEPLDAPPLPQGHEQQHVFSSTLPNDPLRRSNGRYTPIYLATDAHRPRENAIFDRLFETFNCIFTLDDFSDELAPLYEFRNPEDGTLMAKFLIPMVDAMVVAKAGAFFGTPASTFSNYIQKQLRPAYTGLYD